MEEKPIRDYVDEVSKANSKGYNFENSIKVAEILDITIIIHRFFKQHKSYEGNEYDAVTFEFSYPYEEIRWTSQTSSGVIISQLEDEEKKGLPIKVKITKRKNYYTFVAP